MTKRLINGTYDTKPFYRGEGSRRNREERYLLSPCKRWTRGDFKSLSFSLYQREKSFSILIENTRRGAGILLN